MKKEKKFYDDFDPEPKAFYKMLTKAQQKLGWKSMFFMILKYQKEINPDSGYQLKSNL